jgi:DNA polymerase-3 subunit beta
MKFKTSKNQLIDGIHTVYNIVSNKVTLPILSNILLEAKNNKLRMNTTDLDIGISCEFPVEIIEEGGITLPAKRFSDIVKEMMDGDITIHAKKNNQVDIEGRNCRFKLIGLPKDEFPKFPEFKDKEAIIISQTILKNMIRMTSFAVSHEESRYILNGVLFEVSDKTIRIVATDGRRLAKIEKNLEKPVKKEISVIIPIKAISEIFRNLKDQGDVSLVLGSNQALFNIDGVLIATRLIEGEFPNYNQVIPKPSENKVSINKDELLSSIRRANLLATPDFQAVKFEVFPQKMVVSKSTPDVGESREEIAVKYNGNEMVIGFNPNFLIDFLRNVEDSEINIELIAEDKPAVMRLGSYLYLALPMRI